MLLLATAHHWPRGAAVAATTARSCIRPPPPRCQPSAGGGGATVPAQPVLVAPSAAATFSCMHAVGAIAQPPLLQAPWRSERCLQQARVSMDLDRIVTGAHGAFCARAWIATTPLEEAAAEPSAGSRARVPAAGELAITRAVTPAADGACRCSVLPLRPPCSAHPGGLFGCSVHHAARRSRLPRAHEQALRAPVQLQHRGLLGS